MDYTTPMEPDSDGGLYKCLKSLGNIKWDADTYTRSVSGTDHIVEAGENIALTAGIDYSIIAGANYTLVSTTYTLTVDGDINCTNTNSTNTTAELYRVAADVIELEAVDHIYLWNPIIHVQGTAYDQAHIDVVMRLPERVDRIEERLDELFELLAVLTSTLGDMDARLSAVE